MASIVCVPIPAHLYNELVIRTGNPEHDVLGMIEHAIESFLERTEDDDWSEAYATWKSGKRSSADFTSRFGDPDKGYHWTPIFLPNGTKIEMTYDGQQFSAEVRHGKIVFDGEPISSPSALASRIAAGTSRNAWRDLYLKRPTDSSFRLADEIRREGSRK